MLNRAMKRQLCAMFQQHRIKTEPACHLFSVSLEFFAQHLETAGEHPVQFRTNVGWEKAKRQKLAVYGNLEPRLDCRFFKHVTGCRHSFSLAEL